MRSLQGVRRACCTSSAFVASSPPIAVAAKRRKLPPSSPCAACMTTADAPAAAAAAEAAPSTSSAGPSAEQVERAWAWFNRMGAPKYWVAPMVDQSELAFRQLCRRHGVTGAYTPMLHSRLFLEGAPYRAEHFTTCQEDRPLLAQFCANDPATFVRAAQHVQHFVDGVDLNLGCPQRIASRGRYGAYLMDDLPLVERLVKAAVQGLGVPVTVKIRRFDTVEKTVAYAKMLEAAGASLLAIHGRLRQQKRANEHMADWEHIRAVKAALKIPVLGNGNVLSREDADRMMAETGVDGVLSAEPLLADPALFSARRAQQPFGHLDGVQLLLEYCDLLDLHPQPWRMVKGHAFKLLGPWLSEFTDLRDLLNRGDGTPESTTVEWLRKLAMEVWSRVEAIELNEGRTKPVPALSARKLAKLEQEAALAAAIEEQRREEEALAALDLKERRQQGEVAGAGAAAEPAAASEQQQLGGREAGQEQQQKEAKSTAGGGEELAVR